MKGELVLQSLDNSRGSKGIAIESAGVLGSAGSDGGCQSFGLCLGGFGGHDGRASMALNT